MTNLVGTANLLEAAAAVGFEAFVNSGSSSEYGYKDHAPAEDELPEPNSIYAVAKAAATMYCRQRARRSGLPVTTLRLYSAYGPFEEAGRLVPRLITEGLRGRLPPLVNPAVARDFVHVDDVCDAYLRAAAASVEPGAVYNVGSGRQTTIAEIVEIVRKLLAVEAEPAWGTMADRSWDTDVWVANPARIKAELGWSPNLDLEQGLARTIAWHRAGGR
jgi:dolichol-phosphate mannosyltransferase